MIGGGYKAHNFTINLIRHERTCHAWHSTIAPDGWIPAGVGSGSCEEQEAWGAREASQRRRHQNGSCTGWSLIAAQQRIPQRATRHKLRAALRIIRKDLGVLPDCRIDPLVGKL
jgi:hypothetical protein